jgi:rifampicin phosphotransferase
MTNNKKWVYFFGNGDSEGDPQDRDILGGKGAGLAAMSRAGLPVPPGFTISAECCREIEASGGQWPAGLEAQVREALQRLEALTERQFGHGERPLLVAVRSGASISMPGMMDTILNCGLNPNLASHYKGGNRQAFWEDYAFHINMFSESVAGVHLKVAEEDPEGKALALLSHYEEATGRPYPLDPIDALFQCIDAVFRSFNSERAKTYRAHNDIRGVIGTAVNVQAMFPSEKAGILFTANPNDINAGEMVMEASWGLGEVVVSGAVTPDIYVVDAATNALKQTIAGERPIRPDGSTEPVLNEEQILEIAEIGKKVEAYFGAPQDIEWGIADGRLNLLQSRNIRNLDVLQDVEEGRQAEIERLLEEAKGKHTVWVVHNLSETLPNPTPMTWDIIRHFMTGSGGFGLMYQDFGYQPSREVLEKGFLELICGRIYCDPRRAAGLFWGSMPMQYKVEDILEDPQTLEQAPKSLNVEQADPAMFARLPKFVWSVIRCGRRMKRARREALDQFLNVALKRFNEFLNTAGSADLSKMSTGQLIDELHYRRRVVLDDFGKESLKPGFFGGMAQAALQAILEQLMGVEQGANLTRVLTSGLDNDTTVEQNILLYQVAQGEATMEQFLERFGHRAATEMELARPRWREDPSYIERMAETFRSASSVSPIERHHELVATRKKTEAELPDLLAQWGGSSLYEQILPDLKDAQAMLPYRESGKHYLMMGYETIRQVLTELGRRWDIGRGVFFLKLDELAKFESQPDVFKAKIDERTLRWKSSQKLSLSDVIDSEHLDQLGKPKPRQEGEGLEARSIASGTAIGVARIVFDPAEAGDLGNDYILVCPSTDPGWTPLFVNARGLIVERGGILSHGAIVARDFGIPAVVCEQATERIPDGANIEIDGNQGAINLLD